MPTTTAQTDSDPTGWMYALLAFGWWGFVFPLLLIAVNSVALEYSSDRAHIGFEIMANRAVWGILFLFGLIYFLGLTGEFLAVLKSKHALLTLLLSTVFIMGNWFGFILGVTYGKLTEVSLGYYINPLINVLFGFLFLGERLRRLQIVAVALAALGVIWLIFIYGQPPWLALMLAICFACYGLVRKRLKVKAVVGLTYEILFILPVAIGYLIFSHTQGPGLIATQGDALLIFLLILCGPGTALPLIWFAAAAHRMRLSTLGMIQFVAPTGQLIVAIFIRGESITSRLGGYIFIWAAVAFYLWDLVQISNKEAKMEEEQSSDVKPIEKSKQIS